MLKHLTTIRRLAAASIAHKTELATRLDSLRKALEAETELRKSAEMHHAQAEGRLTEALSQRVALEIVSDKLREERNEARKLAAERTHAAAQRDTAINRADRRLDNLRDVENRIRYALAAVKVPIGPDTLRDRLTTILEYMETLTK